MMVYEWLFMSILVHNAGVYHHKSASFLTIVTMLARHSMCTHSVLWESMT
ncbi:hypothetical protein NITLEN_70110 [Nitrospira lenta]|uniref:Uncharacterized protein n=1 Tax=Nitrospira lenta TaxID=1436998 RepID=A0A330LB73_9BACT|nr:hypothetical protein NITLEN_70110 [Nitrospira lenta]